MEIKTPRLLLRPFRLADIPALLKYANERAIWLNMLDQFPHPYTERDARDWIAICEGLPPEEKRENFALELAGEMVGALGWNARKDVLACTAELGYWLALPLHGQGLMSEALGALLPHIFRDKSFTRVQADVFGWNLASARVLEKNGFRCEAILKRAVVKDGMITDLHCYSLLREDFETQHPLMG